MGRKSKSRSRDRSREKKDKHKHKEHKSSRRTSRDKDRKKDKEKSAPSNPYEDLIKSIGLRKKEEAEQAGASRWSDAPENLKIRDEEGNILEEVIKANQTTTNSQNYLKKEHSNKFNLALANSKIQQQPKLDYSDIDYRNRYTGSADPNEQSYPSGNQGFVSSLADRSKIVRKIYMPKNTNFNYTGFIIGPKGSNQKRLEEETGCKILVRGIGSQKEGQPPQPDDNDDLHVLIAGDNEQQIVKATEEIEKIIFADENTRNELKRFQLNMMAQIKNTDPMTGGYGYETSKDVDLSLTTPYGPPSQDAYIIAVPKDCIGLVIGKGGETIRRLQYNSGATKVQVAADNAPGSEFRNVFVEGTDEACLKVKALLNEIVDGQTKLKQAMQGKLPNNQKGIKIIIKIPNNIIGLVIGKSGETIKGINQRTGAVVFMPKEDEHNQTIEKTVIVTGTPECAEKAKKEIEILTKQKNLTLKCFYQEAGEEMPEEVNNPQYTMGGFSTPGYENLHELQNWMTTENWFNYYTNTSTLEIKEYYPDGRVDTKKDIADNNLESMPDITELMKKYLPAPKNKDELQEGGFEDPNQLLPPEIVGRNGGKYFQHQLPGMGIHQSGITIMPNFPQPPQPKYGRNRFNNY